MSTGAQTRQTSSQLADFARGNANGILTWLLCAGIANAVRGTPLVSAGRMFGVNLGQMESGVTLEGWLGGAFRRVAYWYRQPTLNQKARVGRAWLDAFAREGPSAALK